MNNFVLIGDIKISEIKALDNGDSLVDLSKEFPLLHFDFTRKNVQKNSPSISFGRKKVGDNAEPTSCDYKTYFSSTLISKEARNNREILKSCLERVGFVNYPTEWWHWSYGDKYWAFQTGREASIYSIIDQDV